MPVISTLFNSAVFKMETEKMAITETLHVLLINTSVVTQRKRGKKLMNVNPSLFSLGIEGRQVLIQLFL